MREHFARKLIKIETTRNTVVSNNNFSQMELSFHAKCELNVDSIMKKSPLAVEGLILEVTTGEEEIKIPRWIKEGKKRRTFIGTRER